MAISGIVTPTSQQQRPRVQSAARAVNILLEVARSESGLTTKEISDRVGIGRQATYHLLHTLVEAGMLAKTEGRRYVLGLQIGMLADGFGRQLAPAEQLAPIVREIAQRTGETAYGTGWWSNEITTLTVARGTNAIGAAELPQGYTSEAHARAAGKLLLAYAGEAVRSQYFENHELVSLTANTRTEVAALEDDFAKIRELGYSEEHEEFALGLCCLAVPLNGAPSPYALSISAPRDRFLEQRDRYLAEMLEMANFGVLTKD
jgi:DNA-binding IclR family transcriptional regulator